MSNSSIRSAIDSFFSTRFGFGIHDTLFGIIPTRFHSEFLFHFIPFSTTPQMINMHRTEVFLSTLSKASI